MDKINVLIFPAGGENAINIYDSLKYNLHFELFGASSNDDYAKSIYKKDNFCLSNFNITDKNFFENFNTMLKKFNIKYIIPTHDTIAMFLMQNNEMVEAEIVCSDKETAIVANSKKKIFEKLKNKYYIPNIYNDIKSIESFPVFLKPDVGAGGKKTAIIYKKEDFKKLNIDINDFLISEYLPGEELTIDCFTNYKGELLFVGPRTRERITMGISFESKTVELTEEIKKIAEDLNDTFSFNGAWFFQLKKDKNQKYKLMEFSVRQAGTMALYRELGVNFAALSLFNAMKIDVKIIKNDFNISLNRRLTNSYTLNYDYDNIYIDFDDTIIVNNKINSLAMLFLYQSINKKKKIYLITKHATDIYEDLKKYHIDNSIFDEIFLLREEEKKIDFIKSNRSIFIDNYYTERKQVFEKLKIPVFDVDAIECLIDSSEV